MSKLWVKKTYPKSTLFPLTRLALDGMQIEVDAIAFKKEKNNRPPFCLTKKLFK
jgi:hypothetical protein